MSLIEEGYSDTAREIEKGEGALWLRPVSLKNISKSSKLAQKIFPYDAEVIRKSFSASLSPKQDWPRAFRQAVRRFDYYIAKKGDRRIGLTGLTELVDEPEVTAWVDWLGVRKKKQGKGNGRQLVQATIDLAHSQGYRNLRLWTMDFSMGKGLYEPAGFVPQDTPYLCDGNPIRIYNFALRKGQEPLSYEGIAGPDCPLFCGVSNRISYRLT